MTKIVVRVIDAYVFIQKKEGFKFLMLKRAETKIYEHLWQGVAGKIEKGETAYQAAIRELEEETGLSPKNMFIADHISRFYETKEIRDNQGHLVLPKGKRVNSNFTVKYYDDNLGTYVTKSGTDVRTGISNYVHETRINDNKRFIFVLKNEYLQQFLNDFRDIMIYGKSSQFVDDKTVRTENLNISMP